MIISARRALWGTLVGAWAIACLGGLFLLDCRAATTGTSAAPPDHLWDATIPHGSTPGAYQLILFLHPQCPCSRATLHELQKITAQTADRAQITIYFWMPENADATWHAGPLWTAAAKIPNARLIADRGGAATGRFGAKTSGQTMLYNPAGQLVFSGGITPARAHEGDNPGETTIVNTILNDRPIAAATPVFGCALGICNTAPTASAAGGTR